MRISGDTIVDTNVMGVVRTAAALLPILEGNANPAFLATSSALDFVPRADHPTYRADKAFPHSWLISPPHSPMEALELSPPHVQTGLTGPPQATDPWTMPRDAYVAALMRILKLGDHPRGEFLFERDEARRRAERGGSFDVLSAAMNPTA